MKPLSVAVLICLLSVVSSPSLGLAFEPTTSPNGRITLREVKSVFAPYDFPKDLNPQMKALTIEHANHPPFSIIPPDGRYTPVWSSDDQYLVVTNQMDRANFQLVIIRLADYQSVITDFTDLGQQMADMVSKDHAELLTGPSQLSNVTCTPKRCTGRVTQKFGFVDFEIDLEKADFSGAGSPNKPKVTNTRLTIK